MINLDTYDQDAFTFYCEVLGSCKARKDRPDFRKELQALTPSQKECFSDYGQKFDSGFLQGLIPAQYDCAQRADLRSLYGYQKKKIKELRAFLNTHPQTKRQFDTCQNCTINRADTMDHLVPQEEFAEFSVHPKNLFPCCTSCNRIKNNVWRDGSRRLFLNLYLDSLPKQQYLFVSFDSDWLPTFFLKNNDDSIDPNLFQIIESHYHRLNLLERFTSHSHYTIVRLEATIESQGKNIPDEEIKQSILDSCAKLKPIFGYNHWTIILEEALASEEQFIKECKIH